MQLTSTEKLLVAMAYGLYGEDKMDQIHTYLRCNGVDMNISTISQTHRVLQEESKMNGYSDVMSYCEDERYFKAIEMYKEYKRRLYEVLEGGSFEEYSVSSSEEECDVGVESYSIKTSIRVVEDNTAVLGSLTGLGSVKYRNENQLQIEPKTINRVVSRTSKVDSSVFPKDKKRFYWKLTEEEKLMDDYFDVLDGKVESPRGTEGNHYYQSFPAVNDVKRENKDNSSLEISDEKIKNQFDVVLNKISSVKRVEKDKSLWRTEIRVLLEYIMTVVNHKKEFMEIYRKIEINSLSQSIIFILLHLQDIIIESEDGELISACGVLKKYTAAFYDYYKK